MNPFLAELVGTAILILLGNGVVANVNLTGTKGHAGGWIVIAFGWGMAVFVAVWCVQDASGAHLNPAVTIGLWAAGKFSLYKVFGFVAAQMIGAFLGAVLVYLFYRDHYLATADPATKLGTFATGPAIRNPGSNLLSEAVGTAVLVLAGLLAADATVGPLGNDAPTAVKIGLGSLGAIPVGMIVLAIGLSLGGTTGYAINPARDLAPRLAHELLPIPGKGSSDWDYAWIPVVGPTLGAVAAAFLWRALV
jgi:glycerol uptake facilitator protein